ncbi:MAG: NOP5/NOP56 family protein [Candidatus Woesearchaeota archaeon]
MKYWFAHILNGLVLDANLKVLEEIKLSNESGEVTFQKLKKKYSDLQPLPEDKWNKALEHFKDKKYFSALYLSNLEITQKKVREAVSEDGLVMQAISNIKELDQINNLLVKRLREWYSLYFPELSHGLDSHEKFVELVLTKTKAELIKELNVKFSMGADLSQLDREEFLLLAKQIQELYHLHSKHEEYLHLVMVKYCPNILELAGANIGAKLIELGRGLKNLALLPASTIQLLGAEKALFRHLKTGSRSPKFGVIFAHPLIQGVKAKDRGKVSRTLADKLSLCARLDYFHGEFKAPVFRKELEEKFS